MIKCLCVLKCSVALLQHIWTDALFFPPDKSQVTWSPWNLIGESYFQAHFNWTLQLSTITSRLLGGGTYRNTSWRLLTSLCPFELSIKCLFSRVSLRKRTSRMVPNSSVKIGGHNPALKYISILFVMFLPPLCIFNWIFAISIFMCDVIVHIATESRLRCPMICVTYLTNAAGGPITVICDY